jgi:hypothetical protein
MQAASQVNPPGPRWAVRNEGTLRNSDVEMPTCHALQYFMANPRNAERQNDLVGSQSGAIKDVIESERVGELAGFSIYSIIDHIEYAESSSRADAPLYIKMIVVERTPGEYCDIYNDLDETSVMETIEPAYLTDVGSETLLASKDRVSGTGGISKEEYWTFDKDGPIFLDVSNLLDQTLQKLLPKGSSIPKGFAFDIKTLSFKSPVGKEGDCLSCASNGTVNIQFALKNHQLAVDSQEYTPPTL